MKTSPMTGLSKEISEKMEQTRGLRRRPKNAATFSEFLQKQAELKFLLYSAWNVVLPLVQNYSDMAARLGKHFRSALNNLPVGLLRFHNDQHHIHKPRQPRRNTDLADGGHVENNVIVIAGF